MKFFILTMLFTTICFNTYSQSYYNAGKSYAYKMSRNIPSGGIIKNLVDNTNLVSFDVYYNSGWISSNYYYYDNNQKLTSFMMFSSYTDNGFSIIMERMYKIGVLTKTLEGDNQIRNDQYSLPGPGNINQRTQYIFNSIVKGTKSKTILTIFSIDKWNKKHTKIINSDYFISEKHIANN